MQIQFNDISYEAEVLIGSSGLPSVGNSFKKLFQVGFESYILCLSYNDLIHLLASAQDLLHMLASYCAAECRSAGR